MVFNFVRWSWEAAWGSLNARWYMGPYYPSPTLIDNMGSSPRGGKGRRVFLMFQYGNLMYISPKLRQRH